MDSAKNVKWIIPFKKFGMVRVKYNARFNVKFNVIYTGKCSSDEVQCSDYKCIPTQQVCDGIKQCEAGDDEVDCCMYINRL